MAYLRSVDMPFFLSLLFSGVTLLWALGCIVLGIGYALLLYNKNSVTGDFQLRLQFILRVVVVAAIAFLLFAPLIKISNKTLQKPLIIIAQDNSSSIKFAQPANFNIRSYTAEMKAVEKELGRDYEIASFSFGNKVREGLSFTFADKHTNTSALLKEIKNRFSGRNIGAVILATDGIYNRGGNPQIEATGIKSPVYTLALGDTIPKKDLLISNVNYNNIVFLDNRFQVEVTAEAYQSKGFPATVTVSNQQGAIASKPLNVASNNFQSVLSFVLTADKKGINKYTIHIPPIKGELSAVNNTQTIFVEVIDGRKKVLLTANSPHPDISAIKQSIETNKNYEVNAEMADKVKETDIAAADLLILHQLPSAIHPVQRILQQAQRKPVWFILGSQTDVPAFSSFQDVFRISPPGAVSEVLPAFNPDFYAFTLSDTTANRVQSFPPLFSPSGNYSLKGQTSVLLRQQEGKASATKPLLFFSESGQQRVGVLAGEGLWRWRLDEFEKNGNHNAVNELVGKVVQYLSSANDKRKFRVYTAKSVFDNHEHILLNAELYNDSYELINEPDVNLTLKSDRNRTYSYLFSKRGNAYELDAGMLPPGEYSYTANAKVGDKKHTASGRFVIAQQEPELQQTTANHQLLYSLSSESRGEMLYPSELKSLPERIKKNELVKTVSYEDRQYKEPVDFKLIFFLLLALLSLEWFGRKRSGEI